MSCFLCKSSKKSSTVTGEFLQKDNMLVHYYCLLLSDSLPQRGNDEDGLMGFLLEDIESAEKVYRNKTCRFCSKKNATIKCTSQYKCKNKYFHLTCGYENKVLYQFFSKFNSYCSSHYPKVFPTGRPKDDETCSICFDELGPYDIFNILQSACCKSGWFHKNCLAKLALSAGYFCKCPLCNDENVFRSALKRQGIFIPDRDASWELEPDAFSDLLERPQKCCADKCIAAGNKNATFRYCSTCGFKAIHHKCRPSGSKKKDFYCDDCKSIFANSSMDTSSGYGGSVQSDNECADEHFEGNNRNTEIDKSNEAGKPLLRRRSVRNETSTPQIRKCSVRLLRQPLSGDQQNQAERQEPTVPSLPKSLTTSSATNPITTTLRQRAKSVHWSSNASSNTMLSTREKEILRNKRTIDLKPFIAKTTSQTTDAAKQSAKKKRDESPVSSNCDSISKRLRSSMSNSPYQIRTRRYSMHHSSHGSGLGIYK